MAATVHQQQPLGKRDDIESLIWTLMRLCLGRLPWEHGKVSPTAMAQQKLRLSSEGVASQPACRDLPPALVKMFDNMLAHTRALHAPESEPDYAALRKFVDAAWKASGFSATSLAKADLEY